MKVFAMKKRSTVGTTLVLLLAIGITCCIEDGGRPEPNVEDNYCCKKGTDTCLSLSEAKQIAMASECGEQGTLKDNYTCNNVTGTWWIDLDPYTEKEYCPNPACVVNVTSEQTEINWRCTGLLTPTEFNGQALKDSKWRLESFGPLGEVKIISSNTKITLQFGDDNNLNGTGGCNFYFGSYQVGEDNTLSIGKIASTEMWCEGRMEQEQKYLSTLENASSFVVEENRLQLLYNNGKNVLNFVSSE